MSLSNIKFHAGFACVTAKLWVAFAEIRSVYNATDLNDVLVKRCLSFVFNTGSDGNVTVTVPASDKLMSKIDWLEAAVKEEKHSRETARIEAEALILAACEAEIMQFLTRLEIEIKGQGR